jgi:hypothetical protein
MRYFVGLLALAVFMSSSPAWAGKKDDLDKKAVEIVKKVGDLYKDAKAVHADMTIVSTMGEGKDKKEVKLDGTYDLAKPNLVAVRTKLEGEKPAGAPVTPLEMVCDGKKLFTSAKALKQYAETDAPESMTDLGRGLLGMGPPNVGMLFGNIMIDDPYETLMSGVTDCTLAGTEKIEGVECHRIKFKQPEFDWELFIAAEGKPFVMRMTNTREAGDTKVTTVETYKNWKIEDAADKERFSFTPPKDSKKVDELNLRGEGDTK